MSDPLHSALPASRDSPTIAPHLLHSPSHSPPLDHQHVMHNYSDIAPNSPRDLYYSQSPPPEDSPSPISGPITSPNGGLVIHSYGPPYGRQDDVLTVQVDFNNIFHTTVHLRIVFGDLALTTLVESNTQTPAFGQENGQWNLSIHVPSISAVSTHMAEVRSDGRMEWPLTLQAIDGKALNGQIPGTVLDAVGFGLFIYEASPESSPNSSPSENNGSRSPNKSYGDDNLPPTPKKGLETDTDAMSHRRMSVTSEPSVAGSQQRPIANRVLFDDPSPTPSHTLPPGLSIRPHIYQHNLQLQTMSLAQHMPPEAFGVQTTPEEYSEDAPALVRTTQLVSSGEQLAGAKAAQASVAVQGDLDAMKCRWSDSERAAGRRLVQFWKRQVGPTLYISFGAIPQHQYTDNTIVVSCIYRDNINEYYITSVDVIYLLEALAGNRFEVEEKNRIRRNLEGFKPMTISKSKPGTEEFFKVIMDFAVPKPRNIEKDVKVFEWGKLKMMLEKVFSKYSTVPLSPTAPSPPFEGCAIGPPGDLYSFSSSTDAAYGHSTRSHSPETRTKHSPVPTQRLQDVHNVHLPTSENSANLYAEPFVPVKYGDELGYNAALQQEESTYGGMRFLDTPSSLDSESGYLKVDMPSPGGNVNGIVHVNGGGVTLPDTVPGMGHPLDGFRSVSPPSTDTSPTSMSLSLSSGHSSDGEHAESQDMGDLLMGNNED